MATEVGSSVASRAPTRASTSSITAHAPLISRMSSADWRMRSNCRTANASKVVATSLKASAHQPDQGASAIGNRAGSRLRWAAVIR